MRILIVEDDRDLAAALDDALRFEGMRPASHTTGWKRCACSPSNPSTSCCSTATCHHVRRRGDGDDRSNDIPVSVLMLTAAAQVRDRINGLELGADDYLIKRSPIPSYSRAYGRCNAVPVRATSPAPNSHTTASSSTRSVTP